ncbi:MAG: AAA family ATPase [Deltaproteobacteria bacterium]|jgi:hypothetical protein|nr:AAA family ATPase [Deltaproteobacteria bacterium]
MALKEFALGGESFREIIIKKLFYADKTRYVHKLINSTGKHHFLARPRGFGKTLLITTLEELFAGNRNRFEGLWIGGSGYDFPRIPVISLSFLGTSPISPRDLSANILDGLKRIAAQYNLRVKAKTPDAYFGGLVTSLSNSFKSEVAVLVDDYDSPVTLAMGDANVAEANALIIRDFLGALNNPAVSPRVRFSLVTGITRHGLVPGESGPTHLNDVSLTPDHAGICGFTLGEFDSLFADRMEGALAALKAGGLMRKSASLANLRAEIIRWYGGYDWDSHGPQNQDGVLNPYSTLNFFKHMRFDNHWGTIGHLSHLTSWIKANPDDFTEPQLDPYDMAEIREPELAYFQAAPALFHSGYLTLDKITYPPGHDPADGVDEASYSLGFPNHEASSSCRGECFGVIFGGGLVGDLGTKAAELKSALRSKDAKRVGEIFTGYLSPIGSRQGADEKTFRACIQIILSGMGYDVLPGKAGAGKGSALRFASPDGSHLDIGLRFLPDVKQLSADEVDATLAVLAWDMIPSEVVYKYLAAFAREMVKPDTFKPGASRPKAAVRGKRLAHTGPAPPPPDKRNKIMAAVAKDNLCLDVVMITVRVPYERFAMDVRRRALKDIKARGYAGIYEKRPKKFTSLALVVYDGGSQVMASFV